MLDETNGTEDSQGVRRSPARPHPIHPRGPKSLKAWRARYGLSQAECGGVIGKSAQAVRRYESGAVRCPQGIEKKLRAYELEKRRMLAELAAEKAKDARSPSRRPKTRVTKRAEHAARQQAERRRALPWWKRLYYDLTRRPIPLQ